MTEGTRIRKREDEEDVENLRLDELDADQYLVMKIADGIRNRDEEVSDYVAEQAKIWRSWQRESGIRKDPDYYELLHLNDPMKRKPHSVRTRVHQVGLMQQNEVHIWDFIDWIVNEKQHVVVGQELFNEIIEERNNSASLHNLYVDYMKESRKKKEKEEKMQQIQYYQEVVTRFDTAIHRFIRRAHSGEKPEYE